MFAEYRQRREIDIQTYIASKIKVPKGKKPGIVNFTLTDSEKELMKKLGLTQKDLKQMKNGSKFARMNKEKLNE
jgi:hypothetical protein